MQSPDVLVITPRPVDAGDHGAGVRSGKMFDVVSKNFSTVLVQPESQFTPRHARDVLSYRPAALRSRHVLSSGAAEGAAYSAALRGSFLEDLNRLQPRIVFWADALQASNSRRLVAHDARHVVEFANDEASRYATMAKQGRLRRRAFFHAESLKARAWQLRLVQGSDLLVYLSDRDRKSTGHGTRSVVAPNGWPNASPVPPNDSRRALLAVGYWAYGPNKSGMQEFLAREWPQIVQADPSITLRIVGRGAEELVPDPRGVQNVEVLGFVPELAPHYQWCSAVLAPASSGGGSQLKVAEANAYGRMVLGPEYLEREAAESPPAVRDAIRGLAHLSPGIVEVLRDHELLMTQYERLRGAEGRMTWEGQTSELVRAMSTLL